MLTRHDADELLRLATAMAEAAYNLRFALTRRAIVKAEKEGHEAEAAFNRKLDEVTEPRELGGGRHD